MISRFSIKEGNNRLEKKCSYTTEKQENKLPSYESQQLDSYRGQNVLSPIIMETSEDENNIFDNIKSNVQCASGNKFSNSSNKIQLIKNIKRNGDFNEGMKEVTSTDSRFGTPPKFSVREDVHCAFVDKKANFSEVPKVKLDFQNEEVIPRIRSGDLHNNHRHQIQEFQNKSDPGLLGSSRQETDRKEALEAHTMNIVSEIKKSFYEKSAPPKTESSFYKIGRVIGKGAFGKVNLAMHLLAKRLVAIKSVNKKHMKDESSRSKVLLEISILEKCKHPNIVRLFEIFESEKHMLYVSELCVGGDLLTYVRKRRRLKESLAKYLFLQIIDGLRYMHSKGIVHRDVKLDNILLDETGKLKICDFGVSRFTKPGQIMTEQCGTPAYIAPEILKGRGYSGFGVDVWSAGVVLYAMLYGSVPFKGNGIQEMHPYILAGQYTLGDEASETAKDLIRKILTVDHETRITIDQILEHEWMQNIVPKNNIF